MTYTVTNAFPSGDLGWLSVRYQGNQTNLDPVADTSPHRRILLTRLLIRQIVENLQTTELSVLIWMKPLNSI